MKKDAERHLDSARLFLQEGEYLLSNDCDYLAPFNAEESQARVTLDRARQFVDVCFQLCQ